jgi:predicted ATPase
MMGIPKAAIYEIKEDAIERVNLKKLNIIRSQKPFSITPNFIETFLSNPLRQPGL